MHRGLRISLIKCDKKLIGQQIHFLGAYPRMAEKKIAGKKNLKSVLISLTLLHHLLDFRIIGRTTGNQKLGKMGSRTAALQSLHPKPSWPRCNDFFWPG